MTIRGCYKIRTHPRIVTTRIYGFLYLLQTREFFESLNRLFIMCTYVPYYLCTSSMSSHHVLIFTTLLPRKNRTLLILFLLTLPHLLISSKVSLTLRQKFYVASIFVIGRILCLQSSLDHKHPFLFINITLPQYPLYHSLYGSPFPSLI